MSERAARLVLDPGGAAIEMATDCSTRHGDSARSDLAGRRDSQLMDMIARMQSTCCSSIENSNEGLRVSRQGSPGQVRWISGMHDDQATPKKT